MEPLFDTEHLAELRRRALARAVPGADFLLLRVADDLAERLATVERTFTAAALIAPPSPTVERAVRSTGKVSMLDPVERDPSIPDRIRLAPESRDLIVSLLTLHEANDVPGQLIQIRRALRPDGLFLAAFPGAGTLNELRESLLAAETELSGGASPRVAPFIDVRDAGALLQRAGFALPVADVEAITVRYDSLFGLMKDLRAMGATNALAARSRRPATRRFFTRAAEIYADRFADADGRVRATFNIVWLSGWAPHEAQQKPLKPGSATVSLAKVLKEI